ncbi:MAG: alpha-glucosidase C-terminal domain-containing protein [Bacteroidales bacterium]|nr:alpha-glucosidase C-terminal domain-containing protein [Bacteroidales bacterium]
MRKILYLIVVIVFASCQNSNDGFTVPAKSEILGLATPVSLNINETLIYLDDYFLDVTKIDSVSADNLFLELSEDKKQLVIKTIEANTPKLSVLNVWIDNYPYSILLKASQKIEHTIIYNPKGEKYKNVNVAGEINAWDPANTPMNFTDGLWQAKIFLEPGKYQYQFVVDGNWILDPDNPVKEDNNQGGFNSVMQVGETKTDSLPFLYTYKSINKQIIIGCENNSDGCVVFWQNSQLSKKFVHKEDNLATINIPEAATKLEKSYIRIWSYNKFGFSNDILIPLYKGKVINDVSEIKRTDKYAMIIYNIMVDRFFNGKKDNDKPVEDPEILPKANYYGGDISGITKKINDGYFSDLGINTIWLSPIVLNPDSAYGKYPDPYTKFSGYHGYWPISFTKIDHRFGTDNEFHELVTTSHDKNFNVLLDFVANHVHENHPVYKAHTDWATNLYLPDGTLNIERWDDQRLTTWFDTFLPTLDLSKPEVYEMLTDSALFWIKEYNLDGFRHDATKHIPEVFWRTLTKKLKLQFPSDKLIFQIGETYGSRELIGSYVNSGELDGQFDFNLYDASVAVFAKDDIPFTKLKNSLLESFKYFGTHNLMGNITGNQDRARFISYASGALKFDEDAKKAGWKRDIKVENKVGYKKLVLLTAFNMTIPGIPVIYFGDEIGDPGGNDPDNRRMMRFDNLTPDEENVKEITTKLVKLRKNNIPLIYGDTKFLLTTDNTLVYIRTYFEQAVIVIFNKSNTEQKVEFTIPYMFVNKEFISNFGTNFKINNEHFELILKDNSFEILTIKNYN